MKFKFTIAAVLFFAHIIPVYTQVLGNYNAVSMNAGGNLVVNPLSPPISISRISVTASPGFSGVLTAVPSTGKVYITDAKPVGVYTVTLKAFNSAGATTTKSFALTINKPGCSQGNFSGNSQIGAGPNQNNIAVGDFNGDGRQDLALAHEGYNAITIRLGDGHGGFTGSTVVAVGSHPYNLVVGDFDGDGRQDIATTNQGGDNVSVLIGNGLGGFSLNSTKGVGDGPLSIAIGDFNIDGKQDLVVANHSSSNVAVLLGSGTGGFGSSVYYAVAPFPTSVCVSDFNMDGKDDIATTSGANSTVSIRLGNGSGGFTGNTEIPVGSNPYGLTIGDFNRDGFQDLASANYLSNSISIRLGDGLGGFSGNTEVPVGLSPYSVAIGNFNGDEYEDLVTANYFGNTASVRLGDGMGNFSGTNEVNAGSYPICVVVGDFNNDAKQEIAIANYFDYTVSIRMGIAGSPPVIYPFSNGPHCEGLQLELNAYGGGSYTWTGPNGFTSTDASPVIQQPTVANSGLYSVTVTTPNNCTTTASTTVNIHPNPVTSFSVPNDTVCSYNQSMALSGLPFGGSFFGTGISGNEFVPSISGPGLFEIGYIYSDANGCSDTAFDKVSVQLCMGIDQLSPSGNISVFPNPAGKEFKIDFVESAGKCNVELFTPEGKKIRSTEFNATGLYTISAENLSDGIYFLRYTSGKQSGTLRIVKQE